MTSEETCGERLVWDGMDLTACVEERGHEGPHRGPVVGVGQDVVAEARWWAL